MSRKIRVSIALLLLLGVALAAYYGYGRGNPDALWGIVSQRCVPDQRAHGSPGACLKVDLDRRYVVFKDRRGPYHDLVMPTYRVTGIEAPDLQAPDAPNFFADAWRERGRLATESGLAIRDADVALVINSQYGRSQNQLHIHVSCLKPDIHRMLAAEQGGIGPDWRPLGQRINGHVYLAKRLATGDLEREPPFRVLAAYVRAQDDRIAKYGLAVVQLQDGGMALLTSRLDLLAGLNRGSVEEIQDVRCAVAGGDAARP
jgi:CDP-diacylglycerol pyrophosphatase